MCSHRRIWPLPGGVLLALLFPGVARAEDRFATTLSTSGTRLYVASSLVLPLIRDGSRGGARSLRTFDALLTTALLSEGLKRATRVSRPDTGTPDSFPSGHAAATFCAATMMASFHPRESLAWYVGAALISNSRLTLGRHRPADVFAGAALGFLTARAELSSRRGIFIAPVLPSPTSSPRGSLGVVLGGRF